MVSISISVMLWLIFCSAKKKIELFNITHEDYRRRIKLTGYNGMTRPLHIIQSVDRHARITCNTTNNPFSKFRITKYHIVDGVRRDDVHLLPFQGLVEEIRAVVCG